MTAEKHNFYIDTGDYSNTLIDFNNTSILYFYINEKTQPQDEPYQINFERLKIFISFTTISVGDANKAQITTHGFYLLAQSPTSNLLQKKLTQRNVDTAVLDLMGNRTVASSDFKLFIKGYTELINGANQSAASKQVMRLTGTRTMDKILKEMKTWITTMAEY